MIESPDIIERLKTLLENGGAFMALFDRSLIQRSRALELIEVLKESLPEELATAKSLIAKQEEAIEDARRQAGEIIDEAVRRAEKLVDADIITTEAKARADELMKESDEYVSERLVGLEKEISHLLEEVRAGIRAMGGKIGKNPQEAGRSSRPLDTD
jgi:ElaB/YqjD/DUF883 family membrane-anchored ribosome-binding protein